MRAILTNTIRDNLGWWSRESLERTRLNLLTFVRSGRPENNNVGICTNFRCLYLTNIVTGTYYPIKGEPWQTNEDMYYSNQFGGTLYKGSQLKQRRKLAIKLVNVISQYLKEEGYETTFSS